MDNSSDFNEIEEIFKKYDTKHLPVVDRMIIDINRRLLKEKSLSQPIFDKLSNEKTTPKHINPIKDLCRKISNKTAFGNMNKRGNYPNLGEFYVRLNQDIQKRRVKSKIRQQIKKILDKQKEIPKIIRTMSVQKPHLPHKYANEEVEIEKLYGLPGEPAKIRSKHNIKK